MTLSIPVSRGGTEPAIERARSAVERGAVPPVSGEAGSMGQKNRQNERRCPTVPLSHRVLEGGGLRPTPSPATRARVLGQPGRRGVIDDV